MTELKDLRKRQQSEVAFSSLQIGQAYENGEKDICIKTSLSFENGVNYIYFNTLTGKWESEYEYAAEMVTPLNIEINVLP
jgi:hypothetical protein